MGDTSDLYSSPAGGIQASQLTSTYFGRWSARNPDCVSRADISGGVQTFLLCFCIISACQALYFSYHCLPQAGARRRSTWEFVAVPAVEALCYGLASSSSQVGYIQLFDGRTVVWLRTVMWILTTPVLLQQIGKMSYVVLYGFEVNSLIVFVGLLMVIFGFSASLSTVTGIKWMFFFFGFLSMIVVFLGVYKIMVDAGSYYISLNNQDGSQIAARIRILMFIFFFSWTAIPLFWVLSIEGACVVSESVIVVCLAVLDCFAKNIFGIVLWDTVWNSSLEGRWTSNLQVMATEMSMLPEKDVEGSPHDGQLVPYADDEGLRAIEADVVVRPGSAVPGQRRVAGSRVGSRIGSRAGSAAPLEPPPPYPMGGMGGIYSYGGQNDIELSVEQGNAIYPSQMYSMRGSNAHATTQGTPQRQQPSYASDAYEGYSGAALQFGQAGPASILRSRQTSLEKGLLPADTTLGGATAGSIGRFSQSQYAGTGGDGMSRTRDSSSMDDVVDHVRSLNQALSDLLTTDPTLGPSSGARSSHAV